MLSLTKNVLFEYMTLLAKMAKDCVELHIIGFVFDLLSKLLILFVITTVIGNYPQCDQIFTIERHLCLWLYCSNQSLSTSTLWTLWWINDMFWFDAFKDFKDVFSYKHNTISLQWIASKLYFNVVSVKY